MLASVRNKLARGEAALAFVRTSPTTDPGVATLVERLTTSIGEGNTLVQTRGEADNQARSARERRDTLRRLLRRGLLRAFAKAGDAAAATTPALAEEFRQIVPQVAGIEFGAGARSLVASARAHLAQLGPHGITEAMVDQAEGMVREWEQLTARATDGRRARTQARLALQEVGARVMSLLKQLDATFEHLYADQPERLATWRSAVQSTGPIHRRGRAEAESETPGTSGTPPAGDPGSGQRAA
ncbi:MAG: hypothetical protein SFV24_11985 [Gemmatimonadales bacterium]|nr:hypothetical protein [Gemmatimonadales bacterium]